MLWRILNTGFSCPLQVGSYSKRCPREPKGEATLLTLVPEMLLGLIARNLSGLAIGIAAEVLRWTGTAILTELARKRMDGPVQRQPESTWYPVSRNRAVSPGWARARLGGQSPCRRSHRNGISRAERGNGAIVDHPIRLRLYGRRDPHG
jgi:hypothetical protein